MITNKELDKLIGEFNPVRSGDSVVWATALDNSEKLALAVWLDELMRSPNPTTAESSRANSVFAFGYKEALAIARWIVKLTKTFLRSKGAANSPLIERVWSFSAQKSDVDMRIGIQGKYKKFKVTTEMTGPTTLRLRIESWNPAGRPEVLLERFGAFRGNQLTWLVETLPLR